MVLLVWFAQERLQAQQHRLSVVGRRPLVLENVEADAAGEVDVGVVNGGDKKYGGWRVWIVGRELEAELEVEASIWCVFGTFNGSAPEEQVAVGRGERGDARGR